MTKFETRMNVQMTNAQMTKRENSAEIRMTKFETRMNVQMTNAQMTKREENGSFDLEERTALFGEQVIAFAKRIPKNEITTVLIRQIVRSGTSIGANYCEANDAESKKDFRHKIGICRKETKETKHWVRMIVAAEPALRESSFPIWQEAKELNLIFGSILKGSK